MSKITLATVGSISQNPTTAQTTINNNFATIQTAFDNTLSRDDTQPDTMAGNLDMNSFQIVNLPPPASMNSPLRLQDAAVLNGSGTITTGVPTGGSTGQVLAKNSSSNYDTSWQTNFSAAAGGTTGQVMTKNSNADGDYTWSTGFTTGDAKLTLKTSADPGWVLCNDGTIGNGSSGGTTRANADTSALFTLLWNLPIGLTVSGGRGASAAADFAANKNIAMPLFLGRALSGAGTGVGLTARAVGSSFGEENHFLTTQELPPHQHGVFLKDPGHVHNLGISNTGFEATTTVTASSIWYMQNGVQNSASNTTGITIGSVNGVANDNQTASLGGGSFHNTIQPTTYLNVMIKL